MLNLKKANDLELRLVRDNLFRPIKLITQEYSIVSLDQIQTQVESTTQRSIRNAKSMTYVSQAIQIVFETDKVIFVQNLVNHDLPEDELFGAEFDFPNYIQTIDSDLENVGFDIQEVSGIFFKK